MKNKSGFTLIEAMVSILLLSFILLGVHGVLLTASASSGTDLVMVDMQQQARNAMARLVKEVREASVLMYTRMDTNSDRVIFSTPAKQNVQYYLSGNNLVREYPPGVTNNVASNIFNLKFTRTGSLLQISLNADKVFMAKTVSFPLVANVRLRNE